MTMLSTLVTLVHPAIPGGVPKRGAASRPESPRRPVREVGEHLDPIVSGQRATRFQVAQRPEQFYGAFELVYNAYVRSGLAEPNPYRMRVTPYQLLPTTQVFVAVKGSEVIGTVSLVQDGELGLPMEAIYDREISWRRAEGLRLAEVSCLADRHHDLRRSFPVVLRLMSLMAQSAKRRGVDELIIAVHPRHAPFYQRFTAFVPIGGRKDYDAVCGKPAVALGLDLNRAPVDHPYLYEKFFGLPFPERSFACRPMPDSLRSELEPVVEASWGAEGVHGGLRLAAG